MSAHAAQAAYRKLQISKTAAIDLSRLGLLLTLRLNMLGRSILVALLTLTALQEPVSCFAESRLPQEELSESFARTAQTPRTTTRHVDSKNGNRKAALTTWLALSPAGEPLQKSELRLRKADPAGGDKSYIQLMIGDKYWFIYPELQLAIRALYLTEAGSKVREDLSQTWSIPTGVSANYSRSVAEGKKVAFTIISAKLSQDVALPTVAGGHESPKVSKINYYINRANGLLYGHELFAADGRLISTSVVDNLEPFQPSPGFFDIPKTYSVRLARSAKEELKIVSDMRTIKPKAKK